METQPRDKRKSAKGTVVSNKMQKTVVVRVERKIAHPRYGKLIKRAKRVYAHTDNDNYQIGDTVTIMETRPISKTVRWRVVEEKTS